MLIPLRSGSQGNVYVVDDGKTRILLECGANAKALRALCGRPLTDYAGCLISHEHQDHAAGAKALARLGMPIYASAGTLNALALGELRNVRPVDGTPFDLGSLRVRPFDVVHDAAQPLGYLIQSLHTGDKLVFATDTAYLRYTFGNVQEIAVECNYSLASLERSELHESVRKRILRSHFEVDRVIEWLGKCDLSKARRIWLIHLSALHSDAEAFVRKVRGATGVETMIAEGR